MDYNKKGISLIVLIITILVITILASVMIPSGIDKISNARLTSFNSDIIELKEEVDSYMALNNLEYPVKTDASGSYAIYSINTSSTLLAEATKKGDENDTFYIIDLQKLKVDNTDQGVGATIDDYYIVTKTSRNVYYAKGIKIGDLVYYTKRNKGDGLVAVVPTSVAIPTNTPTPTPGGITPTPTSSSTPTNTPTPTPSYKNPIVPQGFHYVGVGTWDNGFTIQDLHGNQFVWVPALDPRIPADGINNATGGSSKFGRRDLGQDIAFVSYMHDPMDATLAYMSESVDKYGGFYIAKYEGSDNGSGKGQSIANMTPWAGMEMCVAQLEAESMDTDWSWNTDIVESYLCYGAHWDTTLEWLYISGAKTSNEISMNSVTWGNYLNDTFSGTTGVENTGQWSQTSAKGIYDLAGNIEEWTMEMYEDGSTSMYICRGGYYGENGDSGTAARRDPREYEDSYIGWRAVLYIK